MHTYRICVYQEQADHGYLSIPNIQVGTKANIYGVVKSFKDARKSNGEGKSYSYMNVLLIHAAVPVHRLLLKCTID